MCLRSNLLIACALLLTTTSALAEPAKKPIILKKTGFACMMSDNAPAVGVMTSRGFKPTPSLNTITSKIAVLKSSQRPSLQSSKRVASLKLAALNKLYKKIKIGLNECSRRLGVNVKSTQSPAETQYALRVEANGIPNTLVLLWDQPENDNISSKFKVLYRRAVTDPNDEPFYHQTLHIDGNINGERLRLFSSAHFDTLSDWEFQMVPPSDTNPDWSLSRTTVRAKPYTADMSNEKLRFIVPSTLLRQIGRTELQARINMLISSMNEIFAGTGKSFRLSDITDYEDSDCRSTNSQYSCTLIADSRYFRPEELPIFFTSRGSTNYFSQPMVTNLGIPHMYVATNEDPDIALPPHGHIHYRTFIREFAAALIQSYMGMDGFALFQGTPGSDTTGIPPLLQPTVNGYNLMGGGMAYTTTYLPDRLAMDPQAIQPKFMPRVSNLSAAFIRAFPNHEAMVHFVRAEVLAMKNDYPTVRLEATDLLTGQPVANAPFAVTCLFDDVTSSGGSILQQGMTDASGRAVLVAPNSSPYTYTSTGTTQNCEVTGIKVLAAGYQPAGASLTAAEALETKVVFGSAEHIVRLTLTR